jgi:hypothetical protein
VVVGGAGRAASRQAAATDQHGRGRFHDVARRSSVGQRGGKPKRSPDRAGVAVCGSSGSAVRGAARGPQRAAAEGVRAKCRQTPCPPKPVATSAQRLSPPPARSARNARASTAPGGDGAAAGHAARVVANSLSASRGGARGGTPKLRIWVRPKWASAMACSSASWACAGQSDGGGIQGSQFVIASLEWPQTYHSYLEVAGASGAGATGATR